MFAYPFLVGWMLVNIESTFYIYYYRLKFNKNLDKNKISVVQSWQLIPFNVKFSLIFFELLYFCPKSVHEFNNLEGNWF